MNELLRYLYSMGDHTSDKLQNSYEINPTTNALPYRLSLLLTEFTFHISESLEKMKDKDALQAHLKVIYRCGVMINETNTMMNRTENNPALNREINAIEEGLSQLVKYVAAGFGEENAKYIVPSHFQQLSGLWGGVG